MSTASDVFHDAFVGEHRATEEILLGLESLAARGSWAEVSERAGAMSKELQAHIYVEEERVYPAVERHADDELSRTLAILHKRHLEIPGYALEVVAAAQDEDMEETIAAIDLLKRVLADHHRTEENEIFPLFAPGGPLEPEAADAVRALSEVHGA